MRTAFHTWRPPPRPGNFRCNAGPGRGDFIFGISMPAAKAAPTGCHCACHSWHIHTAFGPRPCGTASPRWRQSLPGQIWLSAVIPRSLSATNTCKPRSVETEPQHTPVKLGLMIPSQGAEKGDTQTLQFSGCSPPFDGESVHFNHSRHQALVKQAIKTPVAARKKTK